MRWQDDTLKVEPGTVIFTSLVVDQLCDLFLRDFDDTAAACAPPSGADRVGLAPDKPRVLYLHNHVPFREYRTMDYHAKTAAARKLAQQHQKQVIL